MPDAPNAPATAAGRPRVAQRRTHIRLGAVLEPALRDPDSALGRLRTVMDAWCALWYWPVDGPAGCLHHRASTNGSTRWKRSSARTRRIPLQGSVNFSPISRRCSPVEEQLALDFSMQPIVNAREAHPWLEQVEAIRDREGFFHWELEFAPLFEQGGFDLQVGNPPWVRPTWEDDVTLAELDPWFGVTVKPTEEAFNARRAELLMRSTHTRRYVGEVASSAGLVASVGSPVMHPVLAGMQTNLYLVFMDQTWRHAESNGVIGLLHPERPLRRPEGWTASTVDVSPPTKALAVR